MPRLNLNAECKECGEPSEGRYCPACLDELNRYYNSRVTRQENEEWNGESNTATAIDAK